MSLTVETLRGMLESWGYTDVRVIGEDICGLSVQIYTTGLCVHLDRSGYRRRYCYEHTVDARNALLEWDGKGDPPGPWIKEKPSGRLGPGAAP